MKYYRVSCIIYVAVILHSVSVLIRAIGKKESEVEKRRSALSGTVLTVVWLVTAAAALILTVVYLNRLQELYAQADQRDGYVAGESAENNATGVAKNTDVANNQTDLQANANDTGNTDNGNSGNIEGNPTDGNNAGNNGAGTDDPLQTADAGKQDGTGNGDAASGDGSGRDGITEGSDNTAAGADDIADGSGSTADGSGNTADDQNGAGDGTDNGDNGVNIKNRENFDYSLGLDPEKPIIALSFDDGPSVYTERIIAALQANGAEATFFMVGYNVKNYKDVVRSVYNAGMEIGNHTMDHKNLKEQSKETIRSQVFDNEDLINSIVPVGRIIVRPPYGNHNSTVRSIVQRPMFNWSVDSLDWKTRNADSIVAQIKQDARDGYIVLMHDLYETTAEAAERIIPWLISEGYQVTSISKMFKARGVKVEDGKVYRIADPDAE